MILAGKKVNCPASVSLATTSKRVSRRLASVIVFDLNGRHDSVAEEKEKEAASASRCSGGERHLLREHLRVQGDRIMPQDAP